MMESFRPAGVSDDEDNSEEDDLMNDYKEKRSLKRTKLGKSTVTEHVRNPRSTTFQSQNNRIPLLGKSALPLDDFRNAATKGDLKSIKECLDRGVSVDQILTTGWTALMYAGTMTNYYVMKYLLDNGANPNFHCNHYSVLMATCASSRYNEENILECVRELAEKDVDVNAFDRHHMTALLYAAKAGRPKIVEKLVELGANINKQDNRGYTALHWAANKGHVMVVQVLLEKGANTSMKSGDGCLAADIAYVNGKERVCSILRGTGSEQNASRSLQSATAGPSGDSGVPNGTVLCNGSVTQESETESLRQIVGSQSGVCTYGDLEVFLSGVELGQYIPMFQNNRMTFHAFLRMTDHDLRQLGIHQMGHRKKILDAIHATHKKDWESCSLSSIQYNKQLKCSEAIATISNINKHASYISSTVGYITDQIKAHPEILRTGQEGCSIDELMKKSQEGFTNVRNLYSELFELHKHLEQISGIENFHPPDLIEKETKKQTSRIRPKNFLLSLTGISMISIAIWKRDSCLDLLKRLIDWT